MSNEKLSAESSPKKSSDVQNIARQLGERYTELISEDVKRIHKVSTTEQDDETSTPKVRVRGRHSSRKPNEISPSVHRYYTKQRKLLQSFIDAETLLKKSPSAPATIDARAAEENIGDNTATATENMGIIDYVDIFSDEKSNSTYFNVGKHARLAITISFIVNIALFVSKIVAACFSNSMSIISSTIDSGIDVVTTSITFWMSRTINKINIYKHPQGKRRLEPIAILIIACIMSVASFQVITESIKRMATGVDLIPSKSYSSFCIIGVAIVSKFLLALYCSRVKTPTTNTIRQDHVNDIISNSFALIGFALSTYVWKYADSVFALVISVYICFNWGKTAKDNVRYLIGKSASPQAIQRLTWVCLHHHKDIIAIDTVRAYTFGIRYLVEVHLVLAETMLLRAAHDIGESLQQKLESLPEVERAFVHLDYESTHKPQDEHRLVFLE